MSNALEHARLTLLLALLAGCSEAPSGATAGPQPGASDPNFIVIEEDDAEMEAAIEAARASLDFFERHWQTMPNDGYSLKFALPTDDGKVEYIWFAPTAIHKDSFTGECANHPVNVSGLKLGDLRTVTRESVSDWMILVGNQCYGGYTIRILAKRNPAASPPLEFVDPPPR